MRVRARGINTVHARLASGEIKTYLAAFSGVITSPGLTWALAVANASNAVSTEIPAPNSVVLSILRCINRTSYSRELSFRLQQGTVALGHRMRAIQTLRISDYRAR